MEHFARFHAANIYREPRACPHAAGRARGAPAPAILWPASRCLHFRGQDTISGVRTGRLLDPAARPLVCPSSSNAQFPTLPSVTCCLHSSPALDPGSAVGRTWLLRGARGKPRGEQRGNAAEGDQEGPPETGTQGRGAERGPAGSRVQGAAPTKAVTPQRLARSRSCARPGVPCAGQKVTLLPPSKSSAGLMTQLT